MNTREIDIELRSAVMGVITDVWDRSKQIDDAADEVLDLIEADRQQRHLKERAQLNQEWAALKDMQAQYEAALQSLEIQALRKDAA